MHESELSVLLDYLRAVPEGVADVAQTALMQGRASCSGSAVSLFSFLSGHTDCSWILHPFPRK